MDDREFDVRLETVPQGPVVVHVSGELDMATSPQLEETIASAAPVTRLVIDLTDCTFLDSAAIRLLTSTASEVRGTGGELALAVSDPGILRVLEITAVDSLLPVHPTVEAALR